MPNEKPKPVRRPRKSKNVSLASNSETSNPLHKPRRSAKKIKAIQKLSGSVATNAVSSAMSMIQELTGSKVKPSRPKPVRKPRKSMKYVKPVQILSRSIASNAVSSAMSAIQELTGPKVKPSRPKPVRKPRKSMKYVKPVRALSASIAKDAVSSAMKMIQQLTASKVKSERPKPVRKRKSMKHVNPVKKLSASIATNAVSNAMKKLQTIRNISQYKREGPAPDAYSYGLLSGKDSSRSKSPNRSQTPNRPKKARPKPARRPRSQSLSLNTVEKSEPNRRTTANNVTPSFLNSAIKEARQNANFFASAFKARKKASQGRSKEKKAYTNIASVLRKKGAFSKSEMNTATYKALIQEQLKKKGEAI
jgi:hypothetical protein